MAPGKVVSNDATYGHCPSTTVRPMYWRNPWSYPAPYASVGRRSTNATRAVMAMVERHIARFAPGPGAVHGLRSTRSSWGSCRTRRAAGHNGRAAFDRLSEGEERALDQGVRGEGRQHGEADVERQGRPPR